MKRPLYVKLLAVVALTGACEREGTKPKPAPDPTVTTTPRPAVSVPRTLPTGRPAPGNVAGRAPARENRPR